MNRPHFFCFICVNSRVNRVFVDGDDACSDYVEVATQYSAAQIPLLLLLMCLHDEWRRMTILVAHT